MFLVVVAIYSTLGLTPTLAGALRDSDLLEASFVLGMLMVGATDPDARAEDTRPLTSWCPPVNHPLPSANPKPTAHEYRSFWCLLSVSHRPPFRGVGKTVSS